ncbi:glycine receptor subunit alpha-4 isoform X2 [Procambarus clarkii]|uniref:glycine receptor subunit alpha-4 isoform X2 n=1 Tax=Procambarus clarkii TaxID=6728 RepID=UPI001E672E2B|nr:glycine receptor subunit alpha-4-like isoform X2 [Procambarus clarkii]
MCVWVEVSSPRHPAALLVIFTLLHHVRSEERSECSVRLDSHRAMIPLYYDKYTSPATDTNPAIVYFDMKLLDISSINENDMTFSVESFVTYRWKDWRIHWPLDRPDLDPCWNPPPLNITKPLRFSQVCTGNYTAVIPRCVSSSPPSSRRLILPVKFLENIWQPDAFFKNAIRSSVHKDWVSNEFLAFYTSDGHMGLFSRMSITLMCHFDFHHYPHDEQKCEMLIQSLSYKTEVVRFEWCENWAHASSKLDQEIFSLPHFTLAKYEHQVCNGDFPCVKAVFVLVRHPDFHILHTYVPTALIVILSWMSFWIAPDATPARVTLGVTSILTMATQYSQSTKNLPPVSYIKSLDIWMITCMVYVFAALLEFAIVYHVHYRRSLAPSPGLVSTSTNGSTQVTHVTQELTSRRFQRWRQSWAEFWSGDTAIDEASRVLFPLTYFSFVLGYFVLLTGPQEKGLLSRPPI